MPTILEQAIVIRDATQRFSNTPTRVGGCLVDIANALAALNVTPSYLGAQYAPTNPTEIVTAGEYVPVVVTGGTSTVVAERFLDNDDGTFTYSGSVATLFHLNLTMSAHTSTGQHVVHIGAAVNGTLVPATVTSQTLVNGENKSAQICLNCLLTLEPDDTVGIVMTDEHNAEDIYVEHFSLTLVRV